MMSNEQILQLFEIINSALKKSIIHCDATCLFQSYLDFFESTSLDELIDQKKITQLRNNIIMRTPLSRADFLYLTKLILLDGKLVSAISTTESHLKTLDKIFDILSKIEAEEKEFDNELYSLVENPSFLLRAY